MAGSGLQYGLANKSEGYAFAPLIVLNELYYSRWLMQCIRSTTLHIYTRTLDLMMSRTGFAYARACMSVVESSICEVRTLGARCLSFHVNCSRRVVQKNARYLTNSLHLRDNFKSASWHGGWLPEARGNGSCKATCEMPAKQPKPFQMPCLHISVKSQRELKARDLPVFIHRSG